MEGLTVLLQWNLSIADTLGPDIFGHFSVI